MNRILVNAVEKGCDLFNVLRAMTLNPTIHYGLDRALLQVGDIADMIVVDSLETMKVNETYINGRKIFNCENLLTDKVSKSGRINSFNAKKLNKKEIDKLGRQFKSLAKTEARMLVSKLFPSISDRFIKKNTDGMAESILIALYGKNKGQSK